MVVSCSGREHFVGKNLTGFREAPGVERLEPLVNQAADFRASRRAVIPDWLAVQEA
jgi:hypothetical protein